MKSKRKIFVDSNEYKSEFPPTVSDSFENCQQSYENRQQSNTSRDSVMSYLSLDNKSRTKSSTNVQNPSQSTNVAKNTAIPTVNSTTSNFSNSYQPKSNGISLIHTQSNDKFHNSSVKALSTSISSGTTSSYSYQSSHHNNSDQHPIHYRRDRFIQYKRRCYVSCQMFGRLVRDGYFIMISQLHWVKHLIQSAFHPNNFFFQLLIGFLFAILVCQFLDHIWVVCSLSSPIVHSFTQYIGNQTTAVTAGSQSLLTTDGCSLFTNESCSWSPHDVEMVMNGFKHSNYTIFSDDDAIFALAMATRNDLSPYLTYWTMPHSSLFTLRHHHDRYLMDISGSDEALHSLLNFGANYSINTSNTSNDLNSTTVLPSYHSIQAPYDSFSPKSVNNSPHNTAVYQHNSFNQYFQWVILCIIICGILLLLSTLYLSTINLLFFSVMIVSPILHGIITTVIIILYLIMIYCNYTYQFILPNTMYSVIEYVFFSNSVQQHDLFSILPSSVYPQSSFFTIDHLIIRSFHRIMAYIVAHTSGLLPWTYLFRIMTNYMQFPQHIESYIIIQTLIYKSIPFFMLISSCTFIRMFLSVSIRYIAYKSSISQPINPYIDILSSQYSTNDSISWKKLFRLAILFLLVKFILFLSIIILPIWIILPILIYWVLLPTQSLLLLPTATFFRYQICPFISITALSCIRITMYWSTLSLYAPLVICISGLVICSVLALCYCIFFRLATFIQKTTYNSFYSSLSYLSTLLRLSDIVSTSYSDHMTQNTLQDNSLFFPSLFSRPISPAQPHIQSQSSSLHSSNHHNQLDLQHTPDNLPFRQHELAISSTHATRPSHDITSRIRSNQRIHHLPHPHLFRQATSPPLLSRNDVTAVADAPLSVSNGSAAGQSIAENKPMLLYLQSAPNYATFQPIHRTPPHAQTRPLANVFRPVSALHHDEEMTESASVHGVYEPNHHIGHWKGVETALVGVPPLSDHFQSPFPQPQQQQPQQQQQQQQEDPALTPFISEASSLTTSQSTSPPRFLSPPPQPPQPRPESDILANSATTTPLGCIPEYHQHLRPDMMPNVTRVCPPQVPTFPADENHPTGWAAPPSSSSSSSSLSSLLSSESRVGLNPREYTTLQTTSTASIATSLLGNFWSPQSSSFRNNLIAINDAIISICAQHSSFQVPNMIVRDEIITLIHSSDILNSDRNIDSSTTILALLNTYQWTHLSSQQVPFHTPPRDMNTENHDDEGTSIPLLTTIDSPRKNHASEHTYQVPTTAYNFSSRPASPTRSTHSQQEQQQQQHTSHHQTEEACYDDHPSFRNSPSEISSVYPLISQVSTLSLSTAVAPLPHRTIPTYGGSLRDDNRQLRDTTVSSIASSQHIAHSTLHNGFDPSPSAISSPIGDTESIQDTPAITASPPTTSAQQQSPLLIVVDGDSINQEPVLIDIVASSSSSSSSSAASAASPHSLISGWSEIPEFPLPASRFDSKHSQRRRLSAQSSLYRNEENQHSDAATQNIHRFPPSHLEAIQSNMLSSHLAKNTNTSNHLRPDRSQLLDSTHHTFERGGGVHEMTPSFCVVPIIGHSKLVTLIWFGWLPLLLLFLLINVIIFNYIRVAILTQNVLFATFSLCIASLPSSLRSKLFQLNPFQSIPIIEAELSDIFDDDVLHRFLTSFRDALVHNNHSTLLSLPLGQYFASIIPSNLNSNSSPFSFATPTTATILLSYPVSLIFHMPSLFHAVIFIFRHRTMTHLGDISIPGATYLLQALVDYLFSPSTQSSLNRLNNDHIGHITTINHLAPETHLSTIVHSHQEPIPPTVFGVYYALQTLFQFIIAMWSSITISVRNFWWPISRPNAFFVSPISNPISSSIHPGLKPFTNNPINFHLSGQSILFSIFLCYLLILVPIIIRKYRQ